ncbi:glycosyltransferase family 4 protein [Subtercola boreus]|uniref:D-inositol 3-phosphate glycosyltransferase n=1 Tax=Subtercola boreus TaxID=120213 RepID=A0A3E0WCP9_9MICO|nr:glycosyltransferase family 1 protein [Subtercola boreus]RFA22591.1 glycosyl transferase [Subtercola boreus]RFA22947.1 glycosyl transferase [Subtercola boreus]RFA28698.1 glycosyl transferase [Subtercola boreus]
MRVAIVTESFLPTVNGVTNSVCKVLDHLHANGHDAIVICPAANAPSHYLGYPVFEVPAARYRSFPVGLPNPSVQRLLAAFEPDVLHAASPFFLGAGAIAAANRLGVPSVAIFQTDMAGYAKRNHLGPAARLTWKFVRWVHEGASLTLVPSSASMDDLQKMGVPRLKRWARGVDLEAFHPNNRQSALAAALRSRLSPNGEIVVGYVGRLAPEKQVERLAALRGMPGIRLAVVGDGPSAASIERATEGMPIDFLGRLSGRELSAAYASFDIFLHTGTEETFGQTLQEAHAAGLPVIAPRAGGPIDLVADGENGYLYDPADAGELRDLVGDLTASETLRSRFGEAGRRAVLGRTWTNVCDELVKHYESVIDVPTLDETARRRVRLP